MGRNSLAQVCPRAKPHFAHEIDFLRFSEIPCPQKCPLFRCGQMWFLCNLRGFAFAGIWLQPEQKWIQDGPAHKNRGIIVVNCQTDSRKMGRVPQTGSDAV